MTVPVAALYRVSSLKQLKTDEEDTIPVQAKVIRDYIAEHPDWELAAQYKEEGVSAYRKSKDERDVLQRALADALQGRFRILLVFKADRLSRNSFEYPIMLWQLHQANVEVIAVADVGKSLRIEDQGDKLLRFIEGWQAETESKNTSIRVFHALKIMAEKGRWTGGKLPYGFRLSETRSGLPLEINEVEAEQIREMCRLYLEGGIGCKAISGIFNQRGWKTRSGRDWRGSQILNILRNPIIAGLPAFGRTLPSSSGRSRSRIKGFTDLSQFVIPRDEAGKPKPVPAYAIVSLDTWYAIATRRAENRTFNNSENSSSIHRSTALLAGLLKCGYCGKSFLAAARNYSYKRGKRYYAPVFMYKCATHHSFANPKRYCPGQGTYTRHRIDDVFLKNMKSFLTSLTADDLRGFLQSRQTDGLSDASKATRKIRSDLGRAETIRQEWIKRLDEHFAGRVSLYSEELLAAKVKEYDDLIGSFKRELEVVRTQAKAKQNKRLNLLEFSRKSSEWLKSFEAAPTGIKKQMLPTLVEKVVVFKDKIEIHYSVDLAEFVEQLASRDTPRFRQLRVVSNF